MQSSAAAASDDGDAARPQPPRITRALTVRQPWAYSIASGLKDIENRTWQTSHRGWLAIHAASAAADAGEDAQCAQLLGAAGVAAPPTEHLVRSAIIAVVFLEDVLPPDTPLESPWAQPGCFHWLLRDARPLKVPVPCSGSRDVWKLSEELTEAIRAQL